MDERIEKVLHRLHLIKDVHPDFSTLMNDTHGALQDCYDELKRLRWHNNELMNVIYQNQTEIESDAPESRK